LVRYFGIGYLAIRYGADALPYLVRHKWKVMAVVIGLAAASYLLSRLLLPHRTKPGTLK
jgi:hypothetical protein